MIALGSSSNGGNVSPGKRKRTPQKKRAREKVMAKGRGGKLRSKNHWRVRHGAKKGGCFLTSQGGEKDDLRRKLGVAAGSGEGRKSTGKKCEQGGSPTTGGGKRALCPELLGQKDGTGGKRALKIVSQQRRGVEWRAHLSEGGVER